MLKKPITEFDKNFFTEIDKNWGIVTAGNKTIGYNGMTVSWGGIGVLWNKKVAYIFVRKSRYTHDFMEQSDSVTLSFLGDQYKEAKVVFGRKSGRDIDKFAETGLHATFDVDFNGYYIAESDYVFKMKKLYAIDMPTEGMPEAIQAACYPTNDIHTMYVCEITQYLVNEE